jgi:CelD/BcsL family acetyltransferase involved in cellulose biosynthesis
MGGSNAFETEDLVSFHNELTSLALIQGWLRLFVLSLDGVPAAALYAFSYAGKFYFYQSGLDMAYAKQSIGLVTMGLAIKRAIEEGANEYDLLQGREPYKFHWTSQSRDLTQLEFYPPGARGLICRTLDRLDGRARKLARQALPEPLAERLAALTR